jgi:hypothetical protein
MAQLPNSEKLVTTLFRIKKRFQLKNKCQIRWIKTTNLTQESRIIPQIKIIYFR